MHIVFCNNEARSCSVDYWSEVLCSITTTMKHVCYNWFRRKQYLSRSKRFIYRPLFYSESLTNADLSVNCWSQIIYTIEDTIENDRILNFHILLPKPAKQCLFWHQLIPSICTSTHRIELKLVKLLLEKSKLFGLVGNSAKVVIKKTNKNDKNTKPTRIRRKEPITYSCHGVFTDQFVFRTIFRSLINQSAKPTDIKNFFWPFDEV